MSWITSDTHMFMTDGIGPFFVGHPPGRIIWPKIPFHNQELRYFLR